MYFNKINSFADAEARYADTKPIRGNNMDMRPLGKRSRKWERVLKIDDNCYALLEYGTGSDTNWNGEHNGATRAEVRMLAPVLWERNADGTETVRIRNESTIYGHAHSRYSFLQRAMPKTLIWVNNNGKHFVQYLDQVTPPHGYRLCYLPFSKTVAVATLLKNSHSEMQVEDDHKYVTFKRVSAYNFELVSSLHNPAKAPSVRVDKKLKASLKPTLDAFWAWTCAVGPLVQIPTLWREKHDWKEQIRAQVNSWIDEDRPQRRNRVSGYNELVFEPNLLLEILREDTHPMRMVVLKQLVQYVELNLVTNKEELAKSRIRYNRWANKRCNLTSIQERN
jgi:hypothetical protein